MNFILFIIPKLATYYSNLCEKCKANLHLNTCMKLLFLSLRSYLCWYFLCTWWSVLSRPRNINAVSCCRNSNCLSFDRLKFKLLCYEEVDVFALFANDVSSKARNGLENVWLYQYWLFGFNFDEQNYFALSWSFFVERESIFSIL